MYTYTDYILINSYTLVSIHAHYTYTLEYYILSLSLLFTGDVPKVNDENDGSFTLLSALPVA